MVEPLIFSELMACMGRIQQRRGDHYLTVPPLKLDPVSRRLWVNGTEFRLTPKQCDLMTLFMRHPNEIITRKTLMEVVWDTAYLGDTRTLDVHIHWLRSMLKTADVVSSLLETVRGRGYRLNSKMPTL
jgi:DNA-binding response OmpR family regulator